MENWKQPIKGHDVSDESLRSYKIRFFDGTEVEFIIVDPIKVWLGRGHAFHRVLDADGIVSLYHAPGPVNDVNGNMVGFCTLSWVPKDSENKACQW